MHNRNNVVGGILLVIVAIALGIAATFGIESSNKSSIQEWANENKYQIVDTDRCFWDHGPYWLVDEHDTIYCVNIIDHLERKRVAYFRFHNGLLGGYDVEFYDNVKD